MTDRETVITHLYIIRTWAQFSHEHDLQFFTEKHLKDIAQWAVYAIELLKEQEDLGTELTNAVELIHKKNERIKKLLQEQKAVEPKHYEPTRYNGELFACGDCKHELEKKPRFCPYCGKEVKWE